MAKEAESQVLRIVEEDQKKEEGMTFWQRMFSVGGSDKCSLTERKNVLIYLSASIKNLTNMFQVRYLTIDSYSFLPLSAALSKQLLLLLSCSL